jgi:hypothetical protein
LGVFYYDPASAAPARQVEVPLPKDSGDYYVVVPSPGGR